MGDIALLEQIKNFDKDYCYQYQRRLDTYEEDKKKYNWTDEDIKYIELDEFIFKPITGDKKEATNFIKRYEWLGTVGSYPTHWFGAYYNGILGGVIIMGMS